jgi:preprotein translocase subunit SecG
MMGVVLVVIVVTPVVVIVMVVIGRPSSINSSGDGSRPSGCDTSTSDGSTCSNGC